MARYLHIEMFPSGGTENGSTATDAAIRQAIAAIPLQRIREAGLVDALLRLADERGEPDQPHAESQTKAIEEADVDDLIQLALSNTDS
jgi:hypothetical protein